MKTVRVRFAPSPTGPLHIGGARSALFNWLYARHHGGKFILRSEDTDLDRSKREYEEEIMQSLRWLGLDWDEGIDAGGDYGPYRQTERLELYREYAGKLLEAGLAYRCYCTEEELAAEREACLARGEMPRYSGRCRDLSEEERKKLEAQGRRSVIRFKVPRGRTITVQDLVRGRVDFACSDIGDFIILKSDGIATYNFAVVVDDYHMQITHVIRAEEHLSNTPRQILVAEALGWETPVYAHISLILGKDRAKMSKRHGATSIKQYKEMGYLPEAMLNFLALLGWSPKGENEILSKEELIEQFSLDRVAKSPAVFDIEKLNWLNGYYIRNNRLDKIVELALPYLRENGCLTGEPTTAEDNERLKAVVSAVRDYLNNLSEITGHVDIFFTEPSYEQEEIRSVLVQEQVPAVLEAARKKIAGAGVLNEQEAKAIIKQLPKELGFGGKKVFMPLRVALTGRKQGPELFQLLPALGREAALNRLQKALLLSQEA